MTSTYIHTNLKGAGWLFVSFLIVTALAGSLELFVPAHFKSAFETISFAAAVGFVMCLLRGLGLKRIWKFVMWTGVVVGVLGLLGFTIYGWVIILGSVHGVLIGIFVMLIFIAMNRR